jgi:hypothetical protein
MNHSSQMLRETSKSERLVGQGNQRYPFTFYLNNKPKSYLPGRFKEILNIVKREAPLDSFKSAKTTSPEETKTIFEVIDYYYSKQAKENFEENQRTHKLEMASQRFLRAQSSRTMTGGQENPFYSHKSLARFESGCLSTLRSRACIPNPKNISNQKNELIVPDIGNQDSSRVPSFQNIYLNYSMTKNGCLEEDKTPKVDLQDSKDLPRTLVYKIPSFNNETILEKNEDAKGSSLSSRLKRNIYH